MLDLHFTSKAKSQSFPDKFLMLRTVFYKRSGGDLFKVLLSVSPTIHTLSLKISQQPMAIKTVLQNNHCSQGLGSQNIAKLYFRESLQQFPSEDLLRGGNCLLKRGNFQTLPKNALLTVTEFLEMKKYSNEGCVPQSRLHYRERFKPMLKILMTSWNCGSFFRCV